MSRPKEAYGKKIVYRYSGGVIFTLLFSLISIAIYALTFFLPIMANTPEGISVTGLDFIFLYVNFFTGNANTALDALRTNITNVVFAGNGIANAVINVMFYEMGFIFVIMGIYAIILSIGTLILLFTGRLKHWKLPYSMTKRIFIWSWSFYGVIVGLNIYALIANIGYTYETLYTYIFFGGLFVVTIILHIIWGVCFKNHVYVKNEAQLKQYIDEMEKSNVATDTTKSAPVVIQEAPKQPATPAPQQIVNVTVVTPAADTKKEEPADPQPAPQPAPQPQPNNESSDNRKYLPKGLKNIGGHAFSQNTVLEVADIPLGIEVLGAGAFANCVNLREVHIPESVKKIEYNCFFNCMRLKRITYGGSREMWKKVKRGSNWLASAGTKFVVCIDGALTVDPLH